MDMEQNRAGVSGAICGGPAGFLLTGGMKVFVVFIFLLDVDPSTFGCCDRQLLSVPVLTCPGGCYSQKRGHEGHDGDVLRRSLWIR